MESFVVQCKYCNSIIADSSTFVAYDKGTRQALFTALSESRFLLRNRDSTNDPQQQTIYCSQCKNRIGISVLHQNNSTEFHLSMNHTSFYTVPSTTSIQRSETSMEDENTEVRLLETQSAVLSVRDQVITVRDQVADLRRDMETQLRKIEASMDDFRTVLLHHKNILDDLLRQKK